MPSLLLRLRLLLLCLLGLLLLELLLSGGLLLLCLLELLLSGGLLLLELRLPGGLLLLELRLSGGLLLLDFLPRSLGLYSGLSLGLLLREALLPLLLCEALLLLLRLLCLSLSWPVAGDIVHLLGIWGIRKDFRPRMLLIIVKKCFIKKLRNVSKN